MPTYQRNSEEFTSSSILLLLKTCGALAVVGCLVHLPLHFAGSRVLQMPGFSTGMCALFWVQLSYILGVRIYMIYSFGFKIFGFVCLGENFAGLRLLTDETRCGRQLFLNPQLSLVDKKF